MKNILVIALACILCSGCSSLRYEVHQAIESRKIIRVEYDQVWFVSHEHLKARRIDNEALLHILDDMLVDPKSFGGGVGLSHFELYSLLFIKNGTLMLRLTPNLTGGDLGAYPDDQSFPSSWSRNGIAWICYICHEQLLRMRQDGFSAKDQPAAPDAVTLFMKSLRKASNKLSEGTR